MGIKYSVAVLCSSLMKFEGYKDSLGTARGSNIKAMCLKGATLY